MRIVPGEGPRNSPLLAIVGEAPGADEERTGRPFVGSSGFLLDQILAQAGINRTDCYITNVSKVRPPNNDFGAMYYDDNKRCNPNMALLDTREKLWQELHEVKPKVVVALGVEALKALTGYSKLMEYRGTMVEKYGIRVIPSFHPSYLLRGNYGERVIVEADFKKAIRQAKEPSKPFVNFNYDPTFEDVMFFLKQRPEKVAVDIETIQNKIRCIGFATSKHDAICISFMKGQSHAWTVEQEFEILEALSKFMASPDVKKVFQNLMYDGTIIPREFGIQIANISMDTMLAHHVLYPELRKGLDFLCSLYTDHHMYWGYDRNSWRDTALYNCYDCVVTYECSDIFEAELKNRGMWEFYCNNTNKVVQDILYFQSRGVLIDQPERAKVLAETEAEMEETKSAIAKHLGYELNPSSPKQVSELVYLKWGLPGQFKPRAETTTTDAEALQMLAKKHPNRAPVLNLIVKYRELRTLTSYCKQELRNGRDVCSYNVAGTDTSRLASSSTYDGFGRNLQNIPRGKFRRIYRADERKVLIKADLSQAEYRVLVYKARIERVINRWQEDPNWNIHMWNASENIYKVPIEQVTKEMYDNAKNGVYGSNYNIGWLKVSRMYNMEGKVAKFIVDNYHASVPEVRGVYQREIVETLQRTRKLVNPLGRERLFFGRMDDELFRAAYSHYCQSTVADVISLAIIDASRECWECPELGLEILLQVHDELVFQCYEDKVDEALPVIRRCMERPMEIEGRILTIPCGIKIGYDWHNTLSYDKWKESRSVQENSKSNSPSYVPSN